jgi:hypothetical protein
MRLALIALLLLLLTVPTLAQTETPTPVPTLSPAGQELSDIITHSTTIMQYGQNPITGALVGIYNAIVMGFNAVTGQIDFVIDGINGVTGEVRTAASSMLSFLADIGGGIASIVNILMGIILAAAAVVELIGLVVEVVVSAIGLIFGWMGQAVATIFMIITSLADAPAQQIPGLPRCVSAPLESEICALWYIIDWTIIADGTPGAMIVPLLVLIIDLVIVFYVIRSIWGMVQRFQAQLGDG